MGVDYSPARFDNLQTEQQPVNILSRLFGGRAATGHQLIKPDEYKIRFMQTKAPHTLVDVRTAQEFHGGAIPGAINISLQELPQKLKRIPSDKPVVDPFA